MKRCRDPSFTSRPLIPEWRLSRSSITSATVEPDASTDFSPPVCVRRMVGTDTVTAMVGFSSGCGLLTKYQYAQPTPGIPGRSCRSGRVGDGVGTGMGEHVRLDNFNRLLGDLAVDDAVGAQLVAVGIAGGDQHIMSIRLRGVGDIGTRRVGFGGGMRVIDHHWFLVGGIHPAPHPQLLGRVESVEA